jgi:hypothetical protein
MSGTMFDASTPPMIAPPGYAAVAGYVGGDTPHVWTISEWERFAGLRKLPVYVHSQRTKVTTGHDDAMLALSQLQKIGCPPGSRVAVDTETLVDIPHVSGFFRTMRFFGYYVWVYGSADTVFGNPVCNGYWVAAYKDPPVPYMYPGRVVRATQYAAGESYDSSLVKPWELHHLWK